MATSVRGRAGPLEAVAPVQSPSGHASVCHAGFRENLPVGDAHQHGSPHGSFPVREDYCLKHPFAFKDLTVSGESLLSE